LNQNFKKGETMPKGNGKYTVSLKKSGQTGPSTFEEWTESLSCTETTTIGDISKWYKKICPISIRMVGLSITEDIDLNYVEPENDLPF
jgi:hypothetical protein